MFRFLKLLAHYRGWTEWLDVDGVQMQVRSPGLPSFMVHWAKVDEDGVRAANSEELQAFADLYGAKGFRIHAVNPKEPVDHFEMLGPAHQFFVFANGKVEKLGVNQIHGLRHDTPFLWVKES